MYRVGRARLEEGRFRRLNWWEFDTLQKKERNQIQTLADGFSTTAPLIACAFYTIEHISPFF
jgi:hypothetical protein